MRLVISPKLDPEDAEALQAAIDQPMSLLQSIVAKSMVDVEDALIRDRLNALAWLAAAGYLKVKLALRVDESGEIARGIYHEKVGIFSDADGDHVAFNGSANETAGGFMENFESFDVFRSWHDADGRVPEKIADFEALWSDNTPGLRTFDFSQAGRELLEAYRDLDHPPPGIPQHLLNESEPGRSFRAPRSFDLRDYQAEAIREWTRRGGKGILAMATGAGKTLTALYLASKVAEKNSPMVLIVVCPFINLCKQWLREMAAFGLNPVPCYEGRQRWENLMEEGYQRISAGLSKIHSIVVTNSTFQSPAFQARLRQNLGKAHHMIVADEVHNLGAEKIQQFLPPEIQLRLGLSATPERHHDPVGTQAPDNDLALPS